MAATYETLTIPAIDAGSGLREGFADVGDVTLHYVEVGGGPLVVPLHGFPEFWYGWRQQIAPLVDAGFRVVAPDLRGYNCPPDPTASRTTPPTRWPTTSAASSASSVPSPRWWSVTTGADRSPGPWL